MFAQDALPEVSILLPVHNGMPYVEQAVRSMMVQTLCNIEIIVVDDASTDETPAVLARPAAKDPRIHIETLAQNTKLVGALNHGLAQARAPYIARMDAGDISAPERLEIQKRFMDANPGVVLCGTSCRYINAEDKVQKVAVRSRDSVMCDWLIRFRMPLLHPTFIFRCLLPNIGPIQYNSAYPVEDLEFAARIMEFGDIVSLPDVLLDYRVHGASVSNMNWKLQQVKSYDVINELILNGLPDDIIRAMDVPLQSYFRQIPPDPAAFFGGLRAMMAHDIAKNPAYARWFRRQTAQLALDTLVRVSLSKPRIVRAFLRHGPDFLPPLVLRLLEIRNKLPQMMRSDISRFGISQE